MLGLGLGGFVDGILLHQVLQWHHMLTGTREHPPGTVGDLEVNTFADGLFHAGTWLLVVLAVVLMIRSWQARRPAPPWRVQVGMLLAGWGVFNLVEGVVDHMVLEVHHVRDDLGGPLAWDLGFLGLGAVLLVGGLALARGASRPA